MMEKGKLKNVKLTRAEYLTPEARKKHNLPEKGLVAIETREHERKEHPLASLFQGIYTNLPLGVRRETVAVIDGEPMSFRVVKLEVDGNTEVGHKALDWLRELKII